ncbi:hypothetical protein GCM10027280_33850 [Micromonospora polyrhachis]|uniref:Putative RDD family membrane protein YckC n=1 Tax=Micromonospora polyrhachis TaxID=1282883 RepID=A0A7W7SRC8_9ACTN|nr:RDD family protein [Micromonospora polyrhachis]MBB4959543.1 putative RDD family membrane protein YckC [Micromonospora polyrhachis]
MTVQPGWYTDPAEPTTQRYWDGEGWIGAPLPADATPPSGPPPVEPEPVPQSPAASPVGGPTGTPAGPVSPGTPEAGYPPPATPGADYPPPGMPGSPFPPPGVPGPVPPPANGVPGPFPPHAVPPGWPHPHYYRMPPPRPHGHPLASLGARLVARLIDIGIVFLLNVVVNGWFVWRYVQEVAPLYREVFRRSLANDPSTEGLPQLSDQAANLPLVILLIATALWFAYEVPAVANGGQTVGKRLMQIRVVSLAEDPQLGFGRSLRRWSMPLGLPTLAWYCCGIGFVMQLIDCAFVLFDQPLRQALHDKRAATVVVQAPKQPIGPAEERSDDRTDTPGGTA